MYFRFILNLIVLFLGGAASATRRKETQGEKETQTGKGGEKDGQGRSIIIWDGLDIKYVGYPTKAVYLDCSEKGRIYLVYPQPFYSLFEF